jgi:hypothetical protein
MRTGLPYSIACSMMVRKFSSRRLAPTLPGLIRYFASAARTPGTGEQQVAVVVEVADDGHVHARGASPSTM